MLYAKTEEQTYENEVIIYLLQSKIKSIYSVICYAVVFVRTSVTLFFNMFSSIAILNALFEIQYLRKWLTLKTFKIHCKYQ